MRARWGKVLQHRSDMGASGFEVGLGDVESAKPPIGCGGARRRRKRRFQALGRGAEVGLAGSWHGNVNSAAGPVSGGACQRRLGASSQSPRSPDRRGRRPCLAQPVGRRSMWRGSTGKWDDGEKRTSWATQLRKEADFGVRRTAPVNTFLKGRVPARVRSSMRNWATPTGACWVGAGNMDARTDGALDERSSRTSAAQSPSTSSAGGLGAVSARDACRRRWERAMMRARIRSPRWTVSRCSAEYDGEPRSTEFRRLVDGLCPSALLIRSLCGSACRGPGLCRPV